MASSRGLRVVTPCNVAYGGSKVLRNVGILRKNCTTSQPEDLDLNLYRHENLTSNMVSPLCLHFMIFE